MTTELRCLAVQQPWAWALCIGAKDIENRTWTTKHRGPIIIIASAKKTRVNALLRAMKPKTLPTSCFAYSAAIGVVDVVGVEPLNPELESNRWAFGPYCWRIANGRFFPTPIPCQAKLNVYSPDEALAGQICAQMDRAAPVNADDLAKSWIEVCRSSSSAEEHLYAHIASYDHLDDWPNLQRLSALALQGDAENTYLHCCLGVALDEQGQHSEALGHFEELVRLKPDEALGYYLRACAHENLGHEEAAQADFARAKEIDPDIDGEDAAASEGGDDEDG